MNQGFSEFMILPTNASCPGDRLAGDHPVLVTEGIEVTYKIPGNTTSADKTNFWAMQDLLGVNPLTRHRLDRKSAGPVRWSSIV